MRVVVGVREECENVVFDNQRKSTSRVVVVSLVSKDEREKPYVCPQCRFRCRAAGFYGKGRPCKGRQGSELAGHISCVAGSVSGRDAEKQDVVRGTG